MKPLRVMRGLFLYFIIKLEGWSMNLNTKPAELRKIEMKSVCYNGLSPYSMLVKCFETEDEAIIEQAWLCFAEFSVEHKIG